MTDTTTPCTHCGSPVASRALFCHACGSIQPPGAVDPFTRLGLPPGFELDLSTIDRQRAGFARILAPARFADKGADAQAVAKAHQAALDQAAAQLRDPAARARALLDLVDAAPPPPVNGGEWEIAIAVASSAASRTRAIAAVSDAMQAELRLLLDAFRLRDFALCATRLSRIEAMALAIAAAHRA